MAASLPLGACTSLQTFSSLVRIGKGTYGTVYRATDATSGATVALKRITMHNEVDDGFPLTALREVSALRECSQHAGIVRLLGIAAGRSRKDIFLVFEYCEHDLAGLIDTLQRPFSESEAKCITLQIASALSFVHGRHLVHRDLKLSNLLYNNRGEIKLADFGMVRRLTPAPMTARVVTLWYRSPEILLGSQEYGAAVDMWSLGCIHSELMTGQPLLPGKDDLDQLHCILELFGSPTPQLWPSVVDLPLVRSRAVDLRTLLAKYRYNNLGAVLGRFGAPAVSFVNALLVYDPALRPSSADCLAHPYFSSSPLPQEPALMPTFPSTHRDAGAPSEHSRKRKAR